MARTAVNVVGNSLAAVVMSKWEGQYDAEKDAYLKRFLKRVKRLNYNMNKLSHNMWELFCI